MQACWASYYGELGTVSNITGEGGNQALFLLLHLQALNNLALAQNTYNRKVLEKVLCRFVVSCILILAIASRRFFSLRAEPDDADQFVTTYSNHVL